MLPTGDKATDWPKVSVVIPTFNRADFLREALQSVVDQNYPNLEILVVDDGSTDHTPDVVAEFGGKVRYIRQLNGGASQARNRGIQLATGEWVAFLDSDDLFLAGKLRAQMQYAVAHPETVMIYCWYLIQEETGVLRLGRRCQFEGCIDRELLACSMTGLLYTSTMLVRTQTLLQCGGFDETMHLSEDMDLWYRVSRTGPVGMIREVGVQLRRHPGNISKRPGYKKMLAASLRVLNKAFAANSNISWLERQKLCLKARLFAHMVMVRDIMPQRLSLWLRKLWSDPFSTAPELLSRTTHRSSQNAERAA